ncbi:portal protein, partial [Acinetobacter baumannii]
MIRRYRDMAIHPEVDSAVDEVVNEFIVSDAYDSPVEVNLD